MATIKVLRVVWVLGDPEQTTTSGVTIVTRPIYYYPKNAQHPIRVGSIDPDYAEPFMKSLSKAKD